MPTQNIIDNRQEQHNMRDRLHRRNLRCEDNEIQPLSAARRCFKDETASSYKAPGSV